MDMSASKKPVVPKEMSVQKDVRNVRFDYYLFENSQHSGLNKNQTRHFCGDLQLFAWTFLRGPQIPADMSGLS